MTYPDPTDLGNWLNPGPDVSADSLTAWCTDAAVAAVEKACGRTFAVTEPQARTFQAEYFRGQTLVDIDDVMTTDDLVIEVDGIEVTDHVLLPRNAAQKGQPWTQLELPGCVHGSVSITARWGWTEVPSAIRVATAITAARLYERRQNPAGALSFEQVDDVQARWAVSALDSDVETMVAPYRKLWAAV